MRVQTIEKTAKRWKAMQLVGILTIMLLSTTPVKVVAQASGDFTYIHKLDDFTDEDRSGILVVGEEESLVWRCMEDGLNVTVSTGYMVGEDGRVDLRWRIDRNEPHDRVRAPQSIDNMAVYFRMQDVPSFTEEARAGIEVVIEITDPFDSLPEQHRFSLKGLTASLGLLPCYSPPSDPGFVTFVVGRLGAWWGHG